VSLDPLIEAARPIPSHAILAGLAMVVGALQFALPKGRAAHKVAGYVWAGGMAYVAASGFFISSLAVWGRWSPIHLLSALTLFALAYAVIAARQGRIRAHRAAMIQLYVLALLLTGLFTLAPGRIMHEVLFG
jgi:uncharacterized membrane protein